MQVPFPDTYRIKTTGPIIVDGVLRGDGDVIDVPVSGVVVQAPSSTTTDVTSVTLFLAAAAPPPAEELPLWPLFTGL